MGDLGPNPAPVVELAWALHARWGWRARRLHLVADARAKRWFHELDDGLGQLERVVGWRPEVAVHDPPEVPEADPVASVAWHETRWACASEAIAAAGEAPVVFGLFAGRVRAMTAGVALLYAMIARPGDRLVDVRVTDRRVEGATGFYFPEQPEPTWNGVDPRGVDVVLAELAAPSARSRIPAVALGSWRAAAAALGFAVPGAEPPILAFAVPSRKGPVATLDGAPVPLSPALATWYLALALARRAGDGWVAADDLAPLRAALDHVRDRCGQPVWHPDTPLFKAIVAKAPLEDIDEALRKLRRDLRHRLRTWCAAHGVAHADLVVPRLRRRWGGGDQRLALPPSRIRIEGLPPVT